MAREQQSEASDFFEREPEDILLILVFGLALVLTLAGLVMLMIELHGS